MQLELKFYCLWRSLKRLIMPAKHGNDFFLAHSPITNDYDWMLALTRFGYSYNYMSMQYKDQICNVRRTFLIGTEIWQHHLRLYKDGHMTAHTEVAYETDWKRHYYRIGLVPLHLEEAQIVKKALQIGQ